MQRKALFLVAAALASGACQGAPPVLVEDIIARPDRYWNQAVTLVGVAEEPVPEYPGLARGTFQLVDDGGRPGLTVLTDELPAPGREFRVAGVITQRPGFAGVPILMESRRMSAVDWVRIGTFLAGALALLLTGFLVATRRSEATPVVPVPLPQPDPEPIPEPEPKPTKPYTPPSPKTVPFEKYGYLSIAEGPDQSSKELPLGISPYLLGRAGGRKNSLVLSDETVSRSQAKIVWNPQTGVASLVNESDTNRTRVNGQEVDTHHLRTGDRIEFGATALVFRAQGD